MSNTEQERAAFENGAWYWVEHEGWVGDPPNISPARYKAECDAWYSQEFSGISTRYLKVLEPCTRQAARATPAAAQPPDDQMKATLLRLLLICAR